VDYAHGKVIFPHAVVEANKQGEQRSKEQTWGWSVDEHDCRLFNVPANNAPKDTFAIPLFIDDTMRMVDIERDLKEL